MVVGIALGGFTAATLGLHALNNHRACLVGLCPEVVQIQEARQQMLPGSPKGLKAQVKIFTEVLARNPASPYRWCDLGEAHLAQGEVEKARSCFAQAYRMGPNIPHTLIRIVSFHLRQNETAPMLRKAAHILSSCDAYDRLLFSYYDRLGVDTGQILRYGVPPEIRPAQSYFRHVLATAPPEQTHQVWQWIHTRGFHNDELAGSYVAYLLRQKRHGLAADTWAEHTGRRRGKYRRGDYLFNGGFENELTQCPLDWGIRETRGATVKRSDEMAHSGSRSLRIDFLGTENLDYSHVGQTVCVEPGRLTLRIHARTSGITTDQGIAFRIADAEVPARLDLRTEQLRGSSDWQHLELTFVVPVKTQLLSVQVVRSPSRKFDNKIAGTVWIDDATITKP